MAEMEAWITHLLQQDIANLSVHLRTRKEMSKVPAIGILIPEVLAIRDRVAPQTLITINGDIPDRQSRTSVSPTVWRRRNHDWTGVAFSKIPMPLRKKNNKNTHRRNY